MSKHTALLVKRHNAIEKSIVYDGYSMPPKTLQEANARIWEYHGLQLAQAMLPHTEAVSKAMLFHGLKGVSGDITKQTVNPKGYSSPVFTIKPSARLKKQLEELKKTVQSGDAGYVDKVLVWPKSSKVSPDPHNLFL